MIHSLRFRCLPLLLILLSPLGWSAALAETALLARTLESFRDAKTLAIDGVPLLSGRVLADFYLQRGDQLAWRDPARIQALLALVEKSEADGFSPRDFHLDLLRRLSKPKALTGLSTAERIAADIQLTDALLRYLHDTRFGKLDPVAVDPKWNDRAPVSEAQLIADLNGALESGDLGRFVSSRFRVPFWYQDLKRALSRYSGWERVKGLPPLPAGALLEKGSRGMRVSLLRERLQLLGHAAATPPEELARFDDGLSEAVREFQQMAGLSPDGVVGPRTLAALNTPFDQAKVEKIRINLERMRWLYNDLPPDYVFVDVADYMAYLVRDAQIAWSTRVIVGAQDAQTPMFRDFIEHVVFNPNWNVPVSIQKEMGHVSERYTLVDRRTGRKISGGNAGDYKRYRVVQKPGPGNALGQVKFMFPNNHAVYMHDTPSRGLFGRSRRALSHGCVRVQNPMKLAELLLGPPRWSRARINRLVDESKTRYVNLSKPLPVLLYYLTARADDSGAVSVRPDVYGRDQALKDALDKPVLTTRIAFYEPVVLPALAPSVKPAPALKNAQTRPHQPARPPRQARPFSDGVRLTWTEGRDR